MPWPAERNLMIMSGLMIVALVESAIIGVLALLRLLELQRFESEKAQENNEEEDTTPEILPENQYVTKEQIAKLILKSRSDSRAKLMMEGEACFALIDLENDEMLKLAVEKSGD